MVDAAGLDLAGLAVDLALGTAVSRPVDLDTDLRYAWGLGELAGLRKLASEGEIGLREAQRGSAARSGPPSLPTPTSPGA